MGNEDTRTVKAVGYVRCSTQEQADSGLGIAAQLDRIKAYCTLKGLAPVEIIVDEGVSAGKPLSTRAGRKRPAQRRPGSQRRATQPAPKESRSDLFSWLSPIAA